MAYRGKSWSCSWSYLQSTHPHTHKQNKVSLSGHSSQLVTLCVCVCVWMCGCTQFTFSVYIIVKKYLHSFILVINCLSNKLPYIFVLGQQKFTFIYLIEVRNLKWVSRQPFFWRLEGKMQCFLAFSSF